MRNPIFVLSQYNEESSTLHKVRLVFNPLPNDKILDLSKLKGLADDKIILVKMMIYVFDRAENILRKGEKAGYQHFLLFPQYF